MQWQELVCCLKFMEDKEVRVTRLKSGDRVKFDGFRGASWLSVFATSYEKSHEAFVDL